jgi:hypothetical protein
MKYLLGEFDYHFFDISESTPTRLVYCTTLRRLLVAEFKLGGQFFKATQDQLADLEATALTHSAIETLEPASLMPGWARRHFMWIPVDDGDGGAMSFSLHDIINGIEMQKTSGGQTATVDAALATALTNTIEMLMEIVERLGRPKKEPTLH